MGRQLALLYGVLCYLIFFATFLYAIAFVGGVFVPLSLDSDPAGPFAESLLIDAILLGIFAVQHSVMARPAFKRWWTRFVPAAVERSTYVLFSSLALILLFWQWRPLGGMVWQVDSLVARDVLWALFALGWATVLIGTFLINHFDLFGLRQVWLNLRGQKYTGLVFRTPVFYRFVRHPLYVGWLLVFWSTPRMTAAHLVFAATTTLYILVAIQFEERDLMRIHPEYTEYRNRVPKLIPMARNSSNSGRDVRGGQEAEV